MKILVSGSLAYDRIMDFDGRFKDHILPHKIHVLNVSFYVEKFRQSFGGTAGNIAYNLALLGEKPIIISTYGSDFSEYKKWCKRHRMDISQAKKIKNVLTASAYIITDQSDNQITGFFAGAMLKSNGPVPKKLLGKSSLAVIPPGNLTDMKKYPTQYKKTKTSYIYDPGQQITVLSKKDLLSGLTGAKVFISNDYELALVLKKTGLALNRLLKRVELVVTTKGEKGSVIWTRNKKCRIPPAKPKNTSDPTGAGDAYRAGFIKGLVAGYPLPKAGRLGAVVSVYTVEKYGTQTHRFTWKELQRRYYQNFKERL
jgi:adenosine kinase